MKAKLVIFTLILCIAASCTKKVYIPLNTYNRTMLELKFFERDGFNCRTGTYNRTMLELKFRYVDI